MHLCIAVVIELVENLLEFLDLRLNSPGICALLRGEDLTLHGAQVAKSWHQRFKHSNSKNSV